MSLGLRTHLDALGIPGLLAILSYQACKRPRSIRAHHRLLPHPATLRVGTTDVSVFHQVIRHEVYNFGLPAKADVIVDAGANIGLASMFYAQKFPRARIFAIEAERSNFEAMLDNVRPYTNIVPIHAALWNRVGRIRVTDPPPGAFGNWGFAVSDEAGDCPALTVSSLMRQFRIDRIDLLKIDIEGGEKEVFACSDWQDKVDTIVIELHDRFKPGCSESVNRALAGRKKTTEGELTLFI
jgi:FkbM family methyltransferase